MNMLGFNSKETKQGDDRVCLSLSAYGVSVRVHTDCPDLHKALSTFVWPWLPRHKQLNEGTPEGRLVEFSVLRAEDGFRLYAGAPGQANAAWREQGYAARLDEAIPMVQNWLDQEFVSKAQGFLPLHAGAIALGATAAIFPGPSHSGKSTLVRELTRLGCSYYSDEYALLDDHGRLHPYPRALMMRSEAGEVRAALAPHSHEAHPPATVSFIFAMQYRPGAEWRLEPVDQSSMVITLLKNTPREIGPSTNLFGPIASAVSGARCYTGIRGDVRDAARRIKELLRRQS